MPSEHSFVHHRTLESAFYDALPPGTYNNTFINNDVRGESRVFARGVSFPSLSFSLYVCLLLSLPSNPSFLSFLPFFLSFFVSKRNNSTSPGWRVEAPLLSRRSVRVPKDNAKLQGTRAIYGGVGLEKRTKPVCPFRATFEKKVESLTIDSIISQKLLSTKCYSFFDIYISWLVTIRILRVIERVNTSSRRFFIQFRDTFSSPFFPKRFNAFQEWNILIALTGTLFEHVSQCASQIFEICIRRKGGGKGRRVVYGFAWNLHLCLSELSRNSWKTRLVERSLGNGPASTSTSPAIILELILGSGINESTNARFNLAD